MRNIVGYTNLIKVYKNEMQKTQILDSSRFVFFVFVVKSYRPYKLVDHEMVIHLLERVFKTYPFKAILEP